MVMLLCRGSNLLSNGLLISVKARLATCETFHFLPLGLLYYVHLIFPRVSYGISSELPIADVSGVCCTNNSIDTWAVQRPRSTAGEVATGESTCVLHVEHDTSS